MWETLKDGGGPDDLIFPKQWGKDKACWKMLEQAVIKSGVAKWPRLFNNLRASCITEYDDMGFSEKTLDAVFGNSHIVRKKHYVNFPATKNSCDC